MLTGDSCKFDLAVLYTSAKLSISLLKCWLSIIPNLHRNIKKTLHELIVHYWLIWCEKKIICVLKAKHFKNSSHQKNSVWYVNFWFFSKLFFIGIHYLSDFSEIFLSQSTFKTIEHCSLNKLLKTLNQEFKVTATNKCTYKNLIF